MAKSKSIKVLLDFCCQFAVKLCMQTLLAKHEFNADTE